MTTNLQPAGLANAALGRPPPARPQAHGQAVNMRIDKGYEDRLAWGAAMPRQSDAPGSQDDELGARNDEPRHLNDEPGMSRQSYDRAETQDTASQSGAH